MGDEQENSAPLMVTIGELEQRFEELVDRAGEGHEIVITKEDKPVAKLVPMH